ncbi:MAG: hypothetical protein DRI65_07790 [Chloroflexota bacterium]|nr:MAG: hypothetical protein DRI65_07790 [Chloroflexota bacterium]
MISIDHTNGELAEELTTLIESCDIKNATAAVGSIWDELPVIYAITDIYCTPSVMEGFGMSVQEAAATKIPIVSSDLVPFVTEYLAKKTSPKIKLGSGTEIVNGDGAIIVPPGEVESFAFAINMLLSDDQKRQKMGELAYQATVPYFTWEHIVQDFILGIKSK